MHYFAFLFFRFSFPRKFKRDKQYPIFKSGLLLLKDMWVLILGPQKTLAWALSILLVWNPRPISEKFMFSSFSLVFFFYFFTISASVSTSQRWRRGTVCYSSPFPQPQGRAGWAQPLQGNVHGIVGPGWSRGTAGRDGEGFV